MIRRRVRLASTTPAQSRTPFYLGDRIETQVHVGCVEEINVNSAVMRTGNGQVVHVTNVDVLENVIVNRTGYEGRRRSSVAMGAGTSWLIADGEHPEAIQTRLGHGSISVTMGRYGHLMDGLDDQIAVRLDARAEAAASPARPELSSDDGSVDLQTRRNP